MNVEQNTPVVTEAPPFDLVKDNSDGLDIPEFLKRDKDNKLPPKEGEVEKVATQDEGDFGGEPRVIN